MVTLETLDALEVVRIAGNDTVHLYAATRPVQFPLTYSAVLGPYHSVEHHSGAWLLRHFDQCTANRHYTLAVGVVAERCSSEAWVRILQMLTVKASVVDCIEHLHGRVLLDAEGNCFVRTRPDQRMGCIQIGDQLEGSRPVVRGRK